MHVVLGAVFLGLLTALSGEDLSIMLDRALKILFGTKHERDIKKIMPLIDQINELEASMKALTNEQLGAKTVEFRDRYSKGATLDDLLPEAFAVVREAAWRTLGLRHYDVQMIGGIVLHQGKIAEMKTGEGKTLVSTLPVYLNALAGEGVHVVTVNDYLARRDAMWMKPIYDLLGMEIGIIQHNMDFGDRKKAYNSDITYGTNNEYGFDFLRDNMVSELDWRVQRGHYFAIVDEVDSILIDEARTPLIISGPAEENTRQYAVVDKAIRKIIDAERVAPEPPPREVEPGKEEPHVKFGFFYDIDEKSRNVMLTEEGVRKIEELLGVDNLYSPDNTDLVTHTGQGLRAHLIYQDEVDYVVRDGEVIIVDEHTGRLMEGRRYSDGLHQAIEAKENVEIKQETQTLASITFQNFFRMYDKLAGMTGTADTEAEEFNKIYNLDCIVIPTNVPVQRIDHPDRVYRTEKEKFLAIANEIREKMEIGQPVLVGTVSIEKSEVLSQLLNKEGIPHNVLNAKQHQREAEIVQNAGRTGSVTVATNMAGRGTDIVLGGYPLYTKEIEGLDDSQDEGLRTFKELLVKKKFDKAKSAIDDIKTQAHKSEAKRILDMAELWLKEHVSVKEAGGLHILGTERHESRRIDNQLRGRAGRQGDPGSSRFYLSLEDTLMRIFGGQKIMGIMEFLGMTEGQELEARQVDKAIQRAQKRVESHNFDIRKHLLEYDDVMNRQREYVYEERDTILFNSGVRDRIHEWAKEVIEDQVLQYCPQKDTDAWDLEALTEWLKTSLAVEISINAEDYRSSGNPQLDLFDRIWEECEKVYLDKVNAVGEDNFNYVERRIALDVIDARWKDHLYTMDHLREGIWAISYSEKNPLVEYKLEGFRLFEAMVDVIKEHVIEFIFRVQVDGPVDQSAHQERDVREMGNESHASLESFSGSNAGSSLPGFQSAQINIPAGNGKNGRGESSGSVSSGGGSRKRSSRKRKR